MSDRRLRIAVIGVGWWANSVHVPQILSHPGAELVALCARSEAKLRQAGEQFGVTRLYTDYQALLASENLDAVAISATHNAHYPIARAALEAGLHVFCEKPLGLNATETGELARLAEAKGVKTMVAFTNRWVPEAMHARRLIGEGYCGETFHYNVCQLASYGRPGGGWMWRADPALAGGGVLFDLGCHNIDLALWLAGPIRAVCSTLENTSPQRAKDGAMLPTPCDDTDAFIGEFEGGGQGIFHISWTSAGDRIMRHEIVGRDGFLSLGLYHDVWINALRGCRAGEADLLPMAPPDDLQGTIPRAVGTPEEREVAHRAFLLDHPSLVRAFIDCIEADTPPSPSFADGHATQQVMDAVVLSHLERRWVEV
jgi:predicted dehydrogenase